MRHIIPISGKDSLCAALLQSAHQPELEYTYIFCDTGCELPPTYEWLAKVEHATGWEIERIGKPLAQIIHKRNGFLPSQRNRYCTRESKIKPMEEFIGKDSAIVYYGLRADENRTGYVPVASSCIVPSYPLRSRADGGITPHGIDIHAVYQILEAQDLLPPSFFWQRLYDAVCIQLNEVIDWQDSLERWEFNYLFGGRSRANCYFCFYQRQYEELWLLETYPKLFQAMADFESVDAPKTEATAKRNQDRVQLALFEEKKTETRTFTWRAGYSKKELADNEGWQQEIFRRRVADVSSYIMNRLQQKALAITPSDELTQTSCGLICGK